MNDELASFSYRDQIAERLDTVMAAENTVSDLSALKALLKIIARISNRENITKSLHLTANTQHAH